MLNREERGEIPTGKDLTMKRRIGMKMLATAVVCLAGAFLAAAESVVWKEDFSRFEKWRLSGPETLTAALDKEFSPGDTCLKYTFKVDDPAVGFAWPQHIRYFDLRSVVGVGRLRSGFRAARGTGKGGKRGEVPDPLHGVEAGFRPRVPGRGTGAA